MKPNDDGMSPQLRYYYRHKEMINERRREHREHYNQTMRDRYWLNKNGTPVNQAFVDYILLLLREEKTESKKFVVEEKDIFLS